MPRINHANELSYLTRSFNKTLPKLLISIYTYMLFIRIYFSM